MAGVHSEHPDYGTMTKWEHVECHKFNLGSPKKLMDVRSLRPNHLALVHALAKLNHTKCSIMLGLGSIAAYALVTSGCV